MYKSFRSDKHALTDYHLKSCVFWSLAAVTALVLTKQPTLLAFVPAIGLLSSVDIKRVALGALAALVACFATHTASWLAIAFFAITPAWVVFATAILHNAAHGNFKPRWLNRPVGEVFGLFQLVGFPDWVVVHVIHHSHPDDPERDPHPPLDLSFPKFLDGMRASILRVLLKEYFDLHGQSEETKRSILTLALSSKLEQIAKIVFCYAVLGPQAFAFFFAPSIAMKMVHYAWFNYATHQPREREVEIVNRDDGWYRLTNALSFGLYYHRNHHKNPKLFNPSKMKDETARQEREKAA